MGPIALVEPVPSAPDEDPGAAVELEGSEVAPPGSEVAPDEVVASLAPVEEAPLDPPEVGAVAPSPVVGVDDGSQAEHARRRASFRR